MRSSKGTTSARQTSWKGSTRVRYCRGGRWLGSRGAASTRRAVLSLNPARAAEAACVYPALRDGEAVTTGNPHLARVQDAHAKQLAVVVVRERQELRHGRAGV